MFQNRLMLGLGMMLVGGVLSALSSNSEKQLPVTLVRAGDTELEAARNEARQTLPQFVAALSNPAPNQSKFGLKVRVVDGPKVEYIWLRDVSYEPTSGAFSGAVDNDPESVNNVAYGDRINVTQDDVTDWLYVEDGDLRGGYSVKVLLNRQASTTR